MSMASRASAAYHAELQRMLVERHTSEDALNKTVSVEGAYRILQKSHSRNAAALSLIEESLHTAGGLKSTRLRSHPAKSLAVVERQARNGSMGMANQMLGKMITEASMEYDQLHLECSQFFTKQCSLMETTREDISSCNSLAAEWRSKVLSAQTEINVCEVRLPRLQEDLDTTIKECNLRLGYLRRDLKVVLNDIQVLTDVLQMTQCKTFLMQVEKPKLCLCKHPRDKSRVSFAIGHANLHKKLSALQSAHAQKLVQESLEELSEQEHEEAGELEQGERAHNNSVIMPGVTAWKNAPLPQEPLPEDPCQDIDYDAGGEPTGCVLRKTPQCFNLQNKFLTVQGETIDKRDDLLDEIANLEAACKESKETLEAQIEMFTTKMADEHTKLATGTAGENSASEECQMKSREHGELKSSMFQMRTSCSTKFRNLEGELCALKKIRGELSKRYQSSNHAFFQDCEVADKWEERECSATCGGGVQTLERAVITPQSGEGAACPPLKQVQPCNDQPCPIDCVMSQWSGYSACSADCGGGVKQRVRAVRVRGKYGGHPCGDVEETVSCNMDACDSDCELAPWTAWSNCSKACDTGSRTRTRAVSVAAVGRGECPDHESPRRFESKECNTQACIRDKSMPLECASKVDLVLLLDGSGSIGDAGWNSTKNFAKLLVKAFSGPRSDAQISVILYSGPYSYSKMRECTGAASGLDMEADCKVKMVQHFSSDMATTQTNIDALQWPKGTTLTSVALSMAHAELVLGRENAQRVVLTITDGIPLSSRRAGFAAANVKKNARLMFGAVRLSERGLQYMMDWGSKPSIENVLKINSFRDLEDLNTVDTLIGDMCREVAAPVASTR